MSKNVKTAIVIGIILLALAIVLYLLRKPLRIAPPGDNGGNGGGGNGGGGNGGGGNGGGDGGEDAPPGEDEQLLTAIESAFGGPASYNAYLAQKNVTEAQMLEKFKIRYDLAFRRSIINGMQSSHDIRVYVGRALVYNPG